MQNKQEKTQEELLEEINLLKKKLNELESKQILLSDNSECSAEIRNNASTYRHHLEKKLQSEFENAPIGIVHMNISGKILRVNKAFASMMSYSVNELININLLQITHPDDQDGCREHLNKVLKSNTQKKLIKRHITKDGQIIWLKVSLSVELNEDAMPEYIVAFVEDITAQKRSERVLEARLHLMNFAVENSLDELLIEISNVVENLTESNISFFHFLKIDQKQVSLQSWSTKTITEFCKIKTTEREYPLCAAGIWSNCIKKKKTIVDNYLEKNGKLKFPDGHPPVIREMTTPVIRGEQVMAVLGVGNKRTEYTTEDIYLIEMLADLAWDIAERKKNEEKIRQNKQRFKRYLDSGLIGIAVLNSDRSWQYYNNRLCEILGYSADELSQYSWEDVTHPDDLKNSQDLMNSLFRGDTNEYSLEKKYIKKDGSTVYVALYITCTRNKEGQIDSIMGHILDISEIVKTKQEIQESHEIQDKILTGIKAGIIIINPTTRKVESVNSVALNIFKAEENDVLGKRCDVFGWERMDGIPFKSCPALTNTFLNMQLRAKTFSGNTIPVSKTVISSEIMGKKRFIEIIFDISTQKELERRLSLAQKMEALGSLSAGIAHEINTPAQYLGDNINFLIDSFSSILNTILEKKGNGSDNKQFKCALRKNENLSDDLNYFLNEIPIALKQSQDGVQRIIKIVKAMKVFSHPAMESFQSVDLNSVIQNTVTVCRNEWKYNSEIIFDLAYDLPNVQCFANDISQVFLNIIVNSAHAISEKYTNTNEMGTITIRSFTEADYVVIKIEDTGIGISAKNLEKIFDPFFTTKKIGKGTGQGLTLCYSIIKEKHKGSIEFLSRPGEGATCTIKLPVKLTEVSYE